MKNHLFFGGFILFRFSTPKRVGTLLKIDDIMERTALIELHIKEIVRILSLFCILKKSN